RTVIADTTRRRTPPFPIMTRIGGHPPKMQEDFRDARKRRITRRFGRHTIIPATTQPRIDMNRHMLRDVGVKLRRDTLRRHNIIDRSRKLTVESLSTRGRFIDGYPADLIGAAALVFDHLSARTLRRRRGITDQTRG